MTEPLKPDVPPAEPDINSAPWFDQFWAGTALFCSMYYILTLNSEILSGIGMPVAATMLATFVVIIFFNATGLLVTGTGLMIAPAVGISIFVVNFVRASQAQLGHFSWGNAMLGCAFGGVLLIAVSLGSWRTKLIQDLPESVRKGAKAAIGALLISEAIEKYNKFTETPKEGQTIHPGMIDPTFGLITTFICVAVLFAFFRLRERDKAREIGVVGRSALRDVLRLFLRVEFVLVAVLMRVLLEWEPSSYISSLPAHTTLEILGLHPIWANTDHGFVGLILTGLIGLLVWFIVVTDIPGTPNAVLPPSIQQSQFKRAVKWGYINDAIAAFFSPLIGASTTIYYAENQLLTDFKAYGRIAGMTCIFWFCAILFVVIYFDISVERILPPFAVLPILLFIGLFIVAISFRPDGVEHVAVDLPGNLKVTNDRGLEYFLPTAIAVVLAPRIGVEYAIPISIISYWLVGSPQLKQKPTDSGHGPTFVFISWGAAAVLAVVSAMHILTTP